MKRKEELELTGEELNEMINLWLESKNEPRLAAVINEIESDYDSIDKKTFFIFKQSWLWKWQEKK